MVFSGARRLACQPKLCVMLKILYSEVSADADNTYMPVVKYLACLNFEQKISFCYRLFLFLIFRKIKDTGHSFLRILTALLMGDSLYDDGGWDLRPQI